MLRSLVGSEMCIRDRNGKDGARGARGYTGAAGAAGKDGARGPRGYTGATGAAGMNGKDGARGARGYTGATGAAGKDGARGPRGYTGAAGAAGKDGARGARGYTGATGAAGAAGKDGARGARGYTGAAGAMGPAGPAGAAGARGPRGYTGAAGAAGAAGARGARGYTGATGAAGKDGARGPRGYAGAAGAAGPAGPRGPAGRDGARGPAGPAGPRGADGKTPDLNNFCIPDMSFHTFYSANDVSRDFFKKMPYNPTKTQVLYNLDNLIEECLAIKYSENLNLRRYNQCMANQLRDDVYRGREISPHGTPFGPHKFDYMPGFSPTRDCVYQYRWNVSNDLFRSFSSSSLRNRSLSDFCEIIKPTGKGLVSPNCFYNYYIEIALDDQDNLGIDFTEHTDVQVYVGFKKIRCKDE